MGINAISGVKVEAGIACSVYLERVNLLKTNNKDLQAGTTQRAVVCRDLH